MVAAERMSFSGAMPRGRLKWLGPAVVVGAGIATYWTSFSGVFVLDDGHAIVDNARIRHLWPLSELLSGRRPVLDLTLAINYAVDGLNVRGYHLGNLLIHLLAALTLFGIVRRTLRLESLRDRFGPASPYLATVVALAWVVHPLQTQSVTYLIQRSESLMGLFYLMTLYCLIRSHNARRPVFWYAVGVVACLLGMGSKAVMVTVPVTMLLYDRLFLSNSFRDAFRRRGVFFACLAVSWVQLWVMQVAPVVLSTSRARATVGFSVQAFTPWSYALTQFEVLTHYLRIAVWPFPLCLDYGWRAPESLWAVAAPAFLVTSILMWIAGAYVRRRVSSFLGIWFLFILLPTSSIVPIRDAAFEHRMYLPLASVIVLIVVGGYAVCEVAARRMSLRTVAWRVPLLVLALVALISLGVVTSRRNRAYRDTLTMWSDVVRKRPENSRAYDNLGFSLEELGRRSEAIAAFRTAIGLNPRNVNAHHNLGYVLTEEGFTEEGFRHNQIALELDPRHANANRNIGVAFALDGRLDEAIAAFRQAIRSKPLFAEAYYNLCSAFYQKEQYQDALEACRRSIEINPGIPKPHYNLGVTLYELDQPAEAIKAFERALDLSPDLAPAKRGLDLAREKLRTQSEGTQGSS